jgi:hypothetical protein
LEQDFVTIVLVSVVGSRWRVRVGMIVVMIVIMIVVVVVVVVAV